ncbi:MAG: hypothetical protein DRJ40_10570 [Thermoprotei archaeon]|nr:MAG: hypothetical protein DRJ40_10570 [Thermoprotei archaeon]
MLCLKCGSEVGSIGELAAHVVRCPSQVNVLCPVCKERVATGQLLIHILQKHVSSSVCPLCRTRFKQSKQLLPHLREHFIAEIESKGGKKYICLICGRDFTSKRSARVHVLKAHEKGWKEERS